jgi:hypothetical protein
MGDELKVPTRKPTDEQCLAELELVFARVMYVIQWIASTPHYLVDGQHHEVLKEAVAELQAEIKKAADKNKDTQGGDWKRVFSRPRSEDPKRDKPKRNTNTESGPNSLTSHLAEHGLTGQQWVLKFDAFDRHFRGFLDRIALLEKRYEGLVGQVNTLSTMVDLREDADGSLEMGSAIFESAAEALSDVPGAKTVIGLGKEGIAAVRGLFRRK